MDIPQDVLNTLVDTVYGAIFPEDEDCEGAFDEGRQMFC
jgi:hypothetical protein